MGERRADQIFIVRTWLEIPGDERTMRGRIDHVASGKRRYFANFGELCDFVVALRAPRTSAGAAGPSDENEPL